MKNLTTKRANNISSHSALIKRGRTDKQSGDLHPVGCPKRMENQQRRAVHRPLGRSRYLGIGRILRI